MAYVALKSGNVTKYTGTTGTKKLFVNNLARGDMYIANVQNLVGIWLSASELVTIARHYSMIDDRSPCKYNCNIGGVLQYCDLATFKRRVHEKYAKQPKAKIALIGPILDGNYRPCDWSRAIGYLSKDYDVMIRPIYKNKRELMQHTVVLLTGTVTAVYMLCGWEQSPICRAQHAIASALNLQILYQGKP